MRFREVVAMLIPRFLRRAPEPTLKDLRAQVDEAKRIIAEHSVIIKARCAVRRLERTGEVVVDPAK